MSEYRFCNLREALVRKGVAARYAKRAALEIDNHHRDLLHEALARGESPEEARLSADAAIGTEDTLVERYASRKELLSWSHRFPVGYGFAPIVCFDALGTALMLAVLTVMHVIWPHPNDVHVSASMTTGINIALVTLFLWVLPISVAIGFGLFAYRQRISLHWPVVGIVLLCTVAALVNVGFGVGGGPKPPYLEAGIGFGTKTLPTEIARAACKAIAPLIFLAWLRQRASVRFRPVSNQSSLG